LSKKNKSESSYEAAVKSDARTAYFAERGGLGLVSKYGDAQSCAMFRIIRHVTTAPEIPEVPEDIEIERFIPPPAELLSKVLAIFRRVYKEHYSEMIVHLCWNRARQRYYISGPRCAVVGPGHLTYHARRGRSTGTIHSHGSMSAFYSGTDDTHEKGTLATAPGIYMVFGTVTGCAEVVASIAGMGLRKDIVALLPLSEVENVVLTDREYKYWTRNVQVKSAVEAKKEGFFLVDPAGDILQWGPTKESLEPLQDPEDRILATHVSRSPTAYYSRSNYWDRDRERGSVYTGGGYTEYSRGKHGKWRGKSKSYLDDLYPIPRSDDVFHKTYHPEPSNPATPSAPSEPVIFEDWKRHFEHKNESKAVDPVPPPASAAELEDASTSMTYKPAEEPVEEANLGPIVNKFVRALDDDGLKALFRLVVEVMTEDQLVERLTEAVGALSGDALATITEEAYNLLSIPDEAVFLGHTGLTRGEWTEEGAEKEDEKGTQEEDARKVRVAHEREQIAGMADEEPSAHDYCPRGWVKVDGEWFRTEVLEEEEKARREWMAKTTASLMGEEEAKNKKGGEKDQDPTDDIPVANTAPKAGVKGPTIVK
jgi:hypothetical protein